MIDRRAMLGSLLVAPLAASHAKAQERFPSKPIRLLVSFPPGGPLDVMARITAQALSGAFGQIIVDNKPGAGGTLAGREAARADADGHTLLFGSSAALAIGPALTGNPGYDPVKSFVPIAMVSSVPYVMIGATNAPFSTVPELLAYAKAHPGAVNFGVPNGAPPQMLALMFKMQTGADIQVVPYKGASTLITDMLAGRIHCGFETTSVMMGHLNDGHIRALALVRDARIAELPGVPTLAELNVSGVSGSSWSGLLAPAGTPKPVLDQLTTATLEALRSADFREKMKKIAADVPMTAGDEFGAFVAAEYQRIGGIMKTAGLQAQ